MSMSNIDSIAVQLAPMTNSAQLWIADRGDDGLVVVRGVDTPDPKPEDWRERLGWFVRHTPGVEMVGAKRFVPAGQVFSFGEFVIHPKGFHHVGKGVDGKSYRFPEECDTIAGGVAVISQETFENVNGEELLSSLGQLGMLGLGLAIRRGGGRVLAVPQAGVVDTFSPSRDEGESAAFLKAFGFDWVAPDLDHVREAHAGRGLLWNAFFHAGMMPFEKYDQRGAMHWESYQKSDVYRQRADHLAKLVAQYTLPPDGAGGTVVDIGSGDGLFTHLFAMQGCQAIGLDPENEGIAGAERMCNQQQYPPPMIAPNFQVGMGDAMAFEDGSIGCTVMLDVIEHLGNPIGVLNEAARVLKPGGHLICVTPAWQYKAWSDPVYHGFEFTAEELNRLVNSAKGMRVVQNGQIGGVYRDLIVIAQKSA
ncbi:MAG: class I SAM-dependent methyltransferase [Planctomycetota bacterium]